MGLHLRKSTLTSGFANAGRHAMRWLAAGALAVSLSACLDGETTLTVDPDGKSRVDYVMSFDKDAEDIFAFVKAMGDVAPEAAMLKLGACPAASMLPAVVPEFKGFKITGSEYKTDTSYACKIGFDVGPIAEFTSLVSKFDKTGMYEVKEVAPRRYMIAIDYAKMPSMEEILKEVARKQQATPVPNQPPPEVMEKVTQSSVKAGVALVRLMAKNRKSDMVIRAGEIIESNGTIAPDKKSVRFSMTTEEAINLMFKPEERKGKRFYAVVQY